MNNSVAINRIVASIPTMTLNTKAGGQYTADDLPEAGFVLGSTGMTHDQACEDGSFLAFMR